MAEDISMWYLETDMGSIPLLYCSLKNKKQKTEATVIRLLFPKLMGRHLSNSLAILLFLIRKKKSNLWNKELGVLFLIHEKSNNQNCEKNLKKESTAKN